jgi:flagellar biosynthesis protein FliQ
MTAIPLADYGRLGRAHRRTTAIRAALAALLVGLVVAAAVAATQPSTKTLSFLPHGSSGIVVLDLSASISTGTFQRIGKTLTELASTNGRYGLVVFSDVAYEALPPGTPSAALKPYARYFTLPTAQNGFLPQFPINPWTNSFSGGTRIAAGLGLALRIIQGQHLRRPAIVLVSDLDDDPGDLKSLAGVSLAYRQAGIPVRIVALDPQPRDAALFGRLLERAATVQEARLPGENGRTIGADAPPWLATLAVLVALGLAVNELWAARLTWGPA